MFSFFFFFKFGFFPVVLQFFIILFIFSFFVHRLSDTGITKKKKTKTKSERTKRKKIIQMNSIVYFSKTPFFSRTSFEFFSKNKTNKKKRHDFLALGRLQKTKKKKNPRRIVSDRTSPNNFNKSIIKPIWTTLYIFFLLRLINKLRYFRVLDFLNVIIFP